MGEEIRHVVEFLLTIFTNWLVLAGGVVMTVLGIVERARGKEVNWRVYVKILVCLLFAAFYVSWRDSKIQLESQPHSKSPTITVDVKDIEGRTQIDTLKGELEDAKKTLQRQRSDLDPLGKPLVSAKFTVILDFETKEESGHYLGSGAIIYLLGVTEAEAQNGKARLFLDAGVSDHYSDGNGSSTILADCLFNAPAMGSPVRALSEATLIQLEFHDGFFPIGTRIKGGQVALVLNNQFTLNFKIPGQVVDKKANDHPVIRLRNIREELKPLLTPP